MNRAEKEVEVEVGVWGCAECDCGDVLDILHSLGVGCIELM